MSDHLNDKDINQYANLQKIQQTQERDIANQLGTINSSLDNLANHVSADSDQLDKLLAQAESLVDLTNIDLDSVDTNDLDTMLNHMEDTSSKIESPQFKKLQRIDYGDDWQQFQANMLSYAEASHIDLTIDPISELLSKEEQVQIYKSVQEDYGFKLAHCDKYDYTLASFSGVLSGLIDIFFVGSATSSKNKSTQKILSKKSDTIFESAVIRFAGFDYGLRKKLNQSIIPYGNAGKPTTPYDAVHYLEMQYRVPYDAQYNSRLKGDAKNAFKMKADNHHLFSLAHYPDLIGLFFSILDQFNNSGTYIANGKIISAQMKNNKFELKGTTFISKIFCGVVNWIGHIASDAIGSSGAVGKGNRGSGLPVPGTEIFQILNFTLPGLDSKTAFSNLCTKVFENGYDARHAAATAIPVMINELLTRLLWALKQFFYHHRDIGDIVKSRHVPELNRMLLCSYGTFALLDAGDATIKGIALSDGNPEKGFVEAFSRLNINLYPQLALHAYQEVLSWYRNDHFNVEELDRYMYSEWERLANT